MSKKIAILFPVLLLLAVVSVGLYLMFKDTLPPEVVLTPAQGPVNTQGKITLAARDEGSGVREMTVTAVQSGKSVQLLSKTYSPPVPTASETFPIKEANLREGNFTLRVMVRDGSYYMLGQGAATHQEASFALDNRPPRISIASTAHNVKRGGTGCVAYTVSKKAVHSGVYVGDLFFPGFEQPDGQYVCLFAFPESVQPKDFRAKLVARDQAGNEDAKIIQVHTLPRTFVADKVNIPDSFLAQKFAEFRHFYPEETDPLKMYLKVNSEVRQQNAQTLLAIGNRTAGKPLWTGAFLRLPNSAQRSGFGDQRTYLYNGEKIDHQVHLGVDLASLERAPVPAANTGDVVFAAYIGIYGNAVVIDHGLGLQSLYSHLSQIDVREGERVNKGQVIGRTGVSGLAGGDHLHFGIMLSGVPVTPLEWWDPHWIEDNVLAKYKTKP